MQRALIPVLRWHPVQILIYFAYIALTPQDLRVWDKREASRNPLTTYEKASTQKIFSPLRRSDIYLSVSVAAAPPGTKSHKVHPVTRSGNDISHWWVISGSKGNCLSIRSLSDIARPRSFLRMKRLSLRKKEKSYQGLAPPVREGRRNFQIK